MEVGGGGWGTSLQGFGSLARITPCTLRLGLLGDGIVMLARESHAALNHVISYAVERNGAIYLSSKLVDCDFFTDDVYSTSVTFY